MKGYHLKKWLISAIVFVLCFSSIPMEGLTEELNNQEIEETYRSNEKVKEMNNLKEGDEIEELRTETSKVYVDSNGTYSAEVELEPIHFKKDDKWLDIDNTLVTTSNGTEIANKQNKFKVKFPNVPKKGNKAKLFNYQVGNHDVTISFIDDQQKPKVHKGLLETTSEYKKNNLKFKNLYPGVTFDYIVEGSKVKENIILDSYRGKNKFEFFIESTGLDAKKKENGSIEGSGAKTSRQLQLIFKSWTY